MVVVAVKNVAKNIKMKNKKIRTLIFDIETMPNLTRTWGKWEQNTIWNERHWYLWSFSYKWLGESKIYHCKLPDFPMYKKDKYNDLSLTSCLWELFDEADIIIAHNGNAFDLKKVRTLFVKHNLRPPEPYKQIDTKLVAKRYFNFDSNSLKDLAEFLGLDKKLETGGYELWKDCEAGVKSAWKTMEKYNNQDVKVLEELYLTLLPYIDNHPNIALMKAEVESCPNCGSSKLRRQGYAYTRAGIQQKLQCMSCFSWHKQPMKGGQVR